MIHSKDPHPHLQWLTGENFDNGIVWGWDTRQWEASTWILNSVYYNPQLEKMGTWDEYHRWQIENGQAEPTSINGVSLEESAIVTGGGLGYEEQPPPEWTRVSWKSQLQHLHKEVFLEVPPCYRWWPRGSWPVAFNPPTEGSLDEASLKALLEVLTTHSPQGDASACFAYYAQVFLIDYDNVHLWQGSVKDIPSLVDENGGDYGSTPTNIWDDERSWFVWTDGDLQATKVSGSKELIEDIKQHPQLETIDWDWPESTEVDEPSGTTLSWPTVDKFNVKPS